MRSIVPLVLKKSVVGITIAASLSAVAGVVIVASAIAATSTMVATGDVNLRSGPGTSYSIITYIPRGTTVTATGTVSGSWVQVTYNGRTGYASNGYLQTTTTSTNSASVSAGTATTTAAVNVRSGPSTSYAVIGVVASGTTLQTTGRVSGGWTEVLYNGTTRWVYSSYLRSGSTSISAKAVGQVRTTANLNLRTEGYATAGIVGVLPANSIVDITGNATSTYIQILYGGRLLWIYTTYTAPVSTSVGFLSSASLSLMNPYPGSLGPNGGLTPRASWLRDQIKARFGLTCSNYVTSDPTSQHSTGNALDCFGDVSIRRNLQYWAADNARTLEIYYVIHEQRIWSLPSATLGWRANADRGSWTANHMDHVHISLQNPNNEY